MILCDETRPNSARLTPTFLPILPRLASHNLPSLMHTIPIRPAKTGPDTPQECRALVDNWIRAIGSQKSGHPGIYTQGLGLLVAAMEARALDLEKQGK